MPGLAYVLYSVKLYNTYKRASDFRNGKSHDLDITVCGLWFLNETMDT